MTTGAGSSAFLPAVPEHVAPIDPALAGLAHTGPARGVWLVEGLGAYASGPQLEAGGTVELPGTGTAVVRAASLGRAANLLLFPGLVRREFSGAGGTSVETVLAAPELPLVLVQWGGAGSAGARLSVELKLEAGATAARAERGPAALALHGEERGVAIGVTPAPSSWIIEAVAEGTIRVAATLAAGRDTTLLIAGGTPEEVRKAFAAAVHPSGHAVRAAAGPLDEGIACATGIAEIDDGVAWARARLGGLVQRAPALTSEPSEARDRVILSLGLAATAAGDRAVSRHALERLSAGERRGGPPRAHAALLAARHASAFGETRMASALATRCLEVLAAVEAAPGSVAPRATEPGLWGVAARALSDALLGAASDATLLGLRGVAARLDRIGAPAQRALPVVGGASRVLPTVGGPPAAEDWPAWLERLLAGEPTEPAPASDRPAVKALRQATAAFRTDPDAAWIEWRRSLSSGLAAGPAGPATWDDGANDPLTAELLLGLVHGLLGIAYDAPSGRLHLAPRMPRHLTGFAVRGITLGDASLSLRYTRSGATSTFELEPERAAVPPLIVLQPSVQGSVSDVRVDGARASLDVRHEAGRSLVPVQLPLDGARSLEITAG